MRYKRKARKLAKRLEEKVIRREIMRIEIENIERFIKQLEQGAKDDKRKT